MGKIKIKLRTTSSNNQPKHRDDADFEPAVSRRPRCMTHESHDPSPIPVEKNPPSKSSVRLKNSETSFAAKFDGMLLLNSTVGILN